MGSFSCAAHQALIRRCSVVRVEVLLGSRRTSPRLPREVRRCFSKDLVVELLAREFASKAYVLGLELARVARSRHMTAPACRFQLAGLCDIAPSPRPVTQRRFRDAQSNGRGVDPTESARRTASIWNSVGYCRRLRLSVTSAILAFWHRSYRTRTVRGT